MGKSEFQEEVNLLQRWHKKYEPVLLIANADEAWDSIWGLLEDLNVSTDHVWVNYDDGDGSCYLTSFEDAPPPEKVFYTALYVTRRGNEELSSLYLLTDKDVECETCWGADQDCAVCGGTGVEWLELDDVSQLSRDPSVLDHYFLGGRK